MQTKERPEIKTSRGDRASTGRARRRSKDMSTKIIVSYDGTANEDDAIALGGLFAGAGAEVALAYVRHNRGDRLREQTEAQSELLARGAELLGDPGVDTPRRHRPLDPRGPGGARRGRGRRRDRVLLGLAHRQGPRRASATPPSGCSRAARPRSRSRRPTSPSASTDGARHGSSPSATATAARARRPRRWPRRSGARSRRSPTTRPACW